MQALAERLGEVLAGARFESAQPLQFAALKTVTPAPEALSGREVTSVGRRGKYLIVDLGGDRFVAHLSQGGRVDLERPPKRNRAKTGVVRWHFEGAPSVLIKEFGTERKAAWWVLGRDDEGPLAGLGPEPFSDAFAELVRSGDDARRIHTLLRDQRTVAGIGRGYADDILHRARLSPMAALKALDAPARTALLEAVHGVLEEALDSERRRKGGLPTKLGDRFTVHRRFGSPCPRCGHELKRISYESHEVTYCPACQTGGKLLADRRLSRLLR